MSAAQRRDSAVTTAAAAATSVPRRASFPQGKPPQGPTPRTTPRPTFAGMGKRVSTLVRYRMAFQGRRKPAKAEQDQEQEKPLEPIHELPPSPRFSAFLSAEAQFAMMKGYEDKLYERIAVSDPDSKSTLKRSKTPHHNIVIVDRDEEEDEEDGEEGEGEGKGEGPEKSSSSSSTVLSYLTSSYGSLQGSTPTSTRLSPSSLLPSSTRLSPSSLTLSCNRASPVSDVSRSLDPSGRSISPESTTSCSVALPSPFLKPIRRQTLVDLNGNSLTSQGFFPTPEEDCLGSDGPWLQRSNSLPALNADRLSHNKRLVMTYRLESAMGLLDNLKKREEAESSLSPRAARASKHVDAVKDFNSWTQVWNKEFKSLQAK